MNLKPLALALLVIPALPACAADTTDSGNPPPRENVQQTKQAIEDGQLAGPFHVRRAVRIQGPGGGCSATNIATNYAITALHCGVAVGDTVRFYGGDSPYPQSSTDPSRTVVAVGKRPGTSWSVASQSGDLVDSDGIFADFAILKLNTRGPLGSEIATMAWEYPGDDAYGLKIGNGTHEDNQSLFGILMRKPDTTWTSSDADGPFRTSEDALNPGDSGGAFYQNARLLGVASSHDLTTGVWRARYTSVPRHLTWILDVINWAWPGAFPVVTGRMLGGAPLQNLIGKSHIVCQYACAKTDDCAGYNYLSSLNQCQLLSTVTSAFNGTPFTSGIK